MLSWYGKLNNSELADYGQCVTWCVARRTDTEGRKHELQKENIALVMNTSWYTNQAVHSGFGADGNDHEG